MFFRLLILFNILYLYELGEKVTCPSLEGVSVWKHSYAVHVYSVALVGELLC